jgi:gas vesicle protein
MPVIVRVLEFIRHSKEPCQKKSEYVCGYLAAGVGIGAALSIFFAPKSGEETRKWVANKGFDAIDAANKKVWRSRVHLKEIMDRGQLQITEAVIAGREAFGKREAESSVAVL